MFDLEKAISEWRQQMAAGGIKSSAVLDELENHLREDIERQVKSDIDAQEAFESAAKRIGPAAFLTEELKKADHAGAAWRERCVQFAPLLPCLALFPMWLEQQSRGRVEITPTHWGLALASLALSFALVPVGKSVGRFLPITRWQLVRSIAFLAVLGLGFRFLVSLIEFADLVSLQVAMLWIMSPWTAFAVCLAEWGTRCEMAAKVSKSGIAMES